MRASQILKYLEKLAPPSLAVEDDLVGFVFGNIDRDITNVGVAWSATEYVLEQANIITTAKLTKAMRAPPSPLKKKKAPADSEVGMLVLHEYPFFEEYSWSFPGLSFFEKPPNYRRLKSLIAKDVAVYVMHSNLDETEGGTVDILAKAMGMEVTQKIKCGRIGKVADAKFSTILNALKNSYSAEVARIVGDVDSSAKLSIAGCYIGEGLASTDIIEEFFNKGAEVLVSSGLNENTARYASELGISLIDIERSRLERPVMQNLAEKLSEDLKDVFVVHYDCEDAVLYA